MPGHDGPQDGEDEDIAGDEGGQALVKSCGGSYRGQDEGELAAGQQGGGNVRGRRWAVAVQAGGDQPGGDVHHDGECYRHGDWACDRDDGSRVDGQAEGEEEDCGERVA